MADTGEGPRGPVPRLFLDQTEARRTEFFFFGDRPPPPLSKGLDERAPLISRCGVDPALFSTFLSCYPLRTKTCNFQLGHFMKVVDIQR